MFCLSEICLTVMLACFHTCIAFNYLLVGKIAIMANVDYVVYLKTDFNPIALRKAKTP